jgi:hypothetical protein
MIGLKSDHDFKIILNWTGRTNLQSRKVYDENRCVRVRDRRKIENE